MKTLHVADGRRLVQYPCVRGTWVRHLSLTPSFDGLWNLYATTDTEIDPISEKKSNDLCVRDQNVKWFFFSVMPAWGVNLFIEILMGFEFLSA